MLRTALLRARLLALLLAAVAALGVVATAAPADAGTWRSQVPAEAARHRGAPYQWGAAGPSRFDCSGLTMYVYARFGKRLPHSSARQYGVMHHVAKSQKVPGDLLFFRNSSGRISHVAIYAGGNYMWHAPHSGSTVRKVAIYSSSYSVGRL